MTCTDCLRLRRVDGLHICVPGLRSRPQVEKPVAAPVKVQTSGKDHISSYRLPPQWSAAAIWNSHIDRSTS